MTTASRIARLERIIAKMTEPLYPVLFHNEDEDINHLPMDPVLRELRELLNEVEADDLRHSRIQG